MIQTLLVFAVAMIYAPSVSRADVAARSAGEPTLEQSLAGSVPFRRTFLDAMVVEESVGLSRVFHAAQKHAANPVLPRKYDWEGWGPYLYGTVMREGGRLRMWYNCLTPTEDRRNAGHDLLRRVPRRHSMGPPKSRLGRMEGIEGEQHRRR